MSVVSFHILYLLSFTRVPCTCAMTRYRKTLVPTKILSVTWNKRIQPSRTCKELTFQIGIISELTFMTRWLPCILPFHGLPRMYTQHNTCLHGYAFLIYENGGKSLHFPLYTLVSLSLHICLTLRRWKALLEYNFSILNAKCEVICEMPQCFLRCIFPFNPTVHSTKWFVQLLDSLWSLPYTCPYESCWRWFFLDCNPSLVSVPALSVNCIFPFNPTV